MHILKMRHMLDLSYKQQHGLMIKVSEIQDSFSAKQKFLSDVSLESLNDSREIMLTKKLAGEPLYLSIFNFYDCLQNVVRIQKADMLMHGADIQIKTCSMHLPIEADELMITQMLVQLLSRSIYFSTPGMCIFVTIDIKVIDDTSYYCVAFSDTGFGLSNCDRSRIDELRRHQRNQFEHCTDYKLDHVSTILGLHNGYISFKDIPGKGSVVNVLIPCRYEYVYTAADYA
jgi:signal transduction histidine kinase